MSTDPVREFVEARATNGVAVHMSTAGFASRCEVTLDDAYISLQALSVDPTSPLTRRLWVLCPACSCFLALAEPLDPSDPDYDESDPDGTHRAACTSCENCRNSGTGLFTRELWALPGHKTPADIHEVQPGPELDRLVADALGIVPCDAWEPTNFGSAGGPGLMSRGCYHASGACYPTVTAGGGRVGGLPPFSRPAGRRHHAGVTLDDLPRFTSIQKDSEGRFVVKTHTRFVVRARTEPHALSIAVLDAARNDAFTPRFTEETRWRPSWPEVAVRRGVCTTTPARAADLPAPWTPRLVLALDDLIEGEKNLARISVATTLEKSRPKEQRMLFCTSRPYGADPEIILADILAAGDASGTSTSTRNFLTAAFITAVQAGEAQARKEYDARSERLAKEGP